MSSDTAQSTNQTSLSPDERETQLLEALHNHTQTGHHPAQRDLANALGLSLGMVNAILKRLAHKGFVTMQRINGRNSHYLVTPDGIDLIARRSYRYVRRTVGHIVRYKERLREFCRDRKENGVRSVVLVGESDLDFLVEWCAEAEGLDYENRALLKLNIPGPGGPTANVYLVSEQLTPDHFSAMANITPEPIPLMRVLLG